MKTQSLATLVALAASLQGVVATGWHDAPSFKCPVKNPENCVPKQVGGFDWSDLVTGTVDIYGGFQFHGFSCENSFLGRTKRDLLPRTFNQKCITGQASSDKASCPKVTGNTVDKFSITHLQVSVEFDVDLEFHYTLPDKSICKHKASCKKAGSVVENTQCGGATDVTIVYPSPPKSSPKSCHVGIHSVGFNCPSGTSTVAQPTTTPTIVKTLPPVTTATPAVSTKTSNSPATTPELPGTTPAGQSSSTKPAGETSPVPTNTSGVPSASIPGVPATSSTAGVPGPSTSDVPSASVPGVPGTATEGVPSASIPGVPATSSTAGVPGPSTSDVPSASVPGVPGTATEGVPGTTAPGVPATSSTAGVPGPSTSGVPDTTAPGVPGTATEGVPTTTGPAPVTITTVVVEETITTCPVTNTRVTSGVTSIETSLTVSTISITTTKTFCPKCTKTNGGSVPTNPAATSPASPAGSSPAASVSSASPAGSSSVSPAGSSPVASASSVSPNASPVPEAPCPPILPQCLNTWLPDNCSSNSDTACFCPIPDFTSKVFGCLSAHGATQAEIDSAAAYFQGLCAAHVPTNPSLIVDCPTPSSNSTQPGPVTTIMLMTTITVPCQPESGTVTTSSSISVVNTAVTVPQVVLTTVNSGSVNIVAGTAPPPVAAAVTFAPATATATIGQVAPVGVLTSFAVVATPAPTKGSVGTNTIAVPTARFTGAANKGSVGAGVLGAAVAFAVLF